MEFYNKAGYDHAEEIRDTGTLDNSDSAGLRHLGSIGKLPEAERGPFPDSDTWLCETIDIAAERDCYRHIGSFKGKRVIHICANGILSTLMFTTHTPPPTRLMPTHR